MGICVDFSPSEMTWVVKIKGPVAYWLFILCGGNDKADSRANYCFEGGRARINRHEVSEIRTG